MPSCRIHITDGVEGETREALHRMCPAVGLEPVADLSGHRRADIIVAAPADLDALASLARRVPEPLVVVLGSMEDTPPSHLMDLHICAFTPKEAGLEVMEKVLRRTAARCAARRAESAMWHGMEERYAEAQAVMSLALELGAGTVMEDVLERIVEVLSSELGYRIVSIMLLEEDARHLTIRAARGLSDRIVTETRMEVGKGVSGSVARSGEPLLVADVEKDPRFGAGRSRGRYTSKSLICVPLKVGGAVIGVLNVNNRAHGGPLDEHDLRLVTVFAAHASLGIERAKLYASLEHKARELEAAYDRLREVDRIKSDFIVNVSHEYRTPVTVILGYLELLKAGLTDSGHLEKVRTAMDAASRLSSLIDDSTELLRLRTGTAPFSFLRASPHGFLEEAVRMRWARFGEKGVELCLDLPEDLPEVMVDAERMARAVDRLLVNALKFTPAGGRVRVTAAPGDGGGVVVLVEDTGPGIDSPDRERVFELFEQGGDIMTQKPEGTGLGLPIAAAVVKRHGGALELDQSYHEGCRFILRLPPAGEEGRAELEA